MLDRVRWHIFSLSSIDSQRTLLDHDSHDLVKDVGRRHGSQLGITVVRGRDLDKIRRDEIDTLKTPDDGAQFARRPASRLGRSRCRSERRVQCVDVDGQIHGVLGADAFADAANDTLDADGVDLAGLDAREAAVSVVVVIRGPGQSGPDPCVDRAVVGQQSFLARPVEVRAVVDGRLLGRCTPKDLGLPCVQVRVEVDHADWAVCFVDAAQQGEGDGVVAAQSDDSRECLAGFANAGLFGRRVWRACQERVVTFLDLLQGVVVIVTVQLSECMVWSTGVLDIRSHGDVAAVNDFAPEVERVGFHGP